ncbi:MAG: hypothetical protein ACEY3J_03500 [Arsenophonus sp.]
MIPAKRYKQFFGICDYQFDEVRSKAIARLDIIHHKLFNEISAT